MLHLEENSEISYVTKTEVQLKKKSEDQGYKLYHCLHEQGTEKNAILKREETRNYNCIRLRNANIYLFLFYRVRCRKERAL